MLCVFLLIFCFGKDEASEHSQQTVLKVLSYAEVSQRFLHRCVFLLLAVRPSSHGMFFTTVINCVSFSIKDCDMALG